MTAEDENETDGETAGVDETTTAVGTTTASELTDQEASVIFLNQTAGFTFTGEEPNTTSVLIERVVVPEGGFLVVHEAQNVSGDYEVAENVSAGPVVGNSTYLEPGVHGNVVVELDGDLNGSQTLAAMPHRDTNDNQQYDFPEADDPYTIDGSPVIETAYIIVDYDVIDVTFDETTEAGEETTQVSNATTEA
jgi:hypothetical protein